MSLRFVYSPRSTLVIAGAQSLFVTKHAAAVRKHYSVTATRRSMDLLGRNAVMNPESLLTLSTPSVQEGDSGETVLRFVLSRDTDGFPSIAYSAETTTAGTATVAVDFEAFTGSGTIASGASVNLDVVVIGDIDAESDETVVMEVTGAWA
jgi:hypothetical protein